MGKNDIKLSPKHGLNPTIPICFWCGKEKGEIALLGHIGNRRKGEDIEAPRNMVLDYIPCPACEEAMAAGFTVIEGSDAPITQNQPPLSDKQDIYPTGRWLVLRREAAEAMFGPWAASQGVELRDRIVVDREIFDRFMEDGDTNA